MQVNPHKNASTTPAIRRELRESPLSIAELARRYNLSKATHGAQVAIMGRWCRPFPPPAPPAPPAPPQTTLSPAQEAVVVAPGAKRYCPG